MFLPILHSEDGYGFTYGARISFVDRLGPRSRITVPLTWGGERQARVQLERAFKSGPIERVAGEFGISRRENPHYEIGDRRVGFGARLESAPARWLRLGAGGRRDDVRVWRCRGHGVALRRRRHDRHPRRSGVPAQRHPRHVRHRSRDVRCRPRQPEEGRRARLRRAVRTDGAGGARPERHDRRARCRRTSTTCSAARRTCAATTPATRPATISPPHRPSCASRSPLRSSIGRFGVKAFVDWGTIYGVGDKLSDQAFEIAASAAAPTCTSPSSACRSTSPDRDSGDTRFHFGMGVTFK